MAGGEKTNERPGWLIPALTGLGMGGGAYALARRSKLAPIGTMLRRIQEESGGKFYRTDLGASSFGKERFSTKDNAPLLDRIKRFFYYGPTKNLKDPKVLAELKAQHKDTGKRAVIYGGGVDPKHYKFLLNTLHGDAANAKDLAQIEKLRLSLGGDKLVEHRLLKNIAPDTVARTSSLGELLKKHRIKPPTKGRITRKYLEGIQEALRTEFPKGHIIKTRGEAKAVDQLAGSSGKFPTENTDLWESYRLWRRMGPAFKKRMATSNSPNKVIGAFRCKPGYEGRVIEDLKNKNVIFQEKLPIKGYGKRTTENLLRKGHGTTQEFRIHVLGGQASPELAMPRYPGMSPTTLVNTVKARRAAKWLQKEVVDNLPHTHRHLPMAVDVAPLKGGGFKVIELNAGNESGLLDAMNNPLASHQMHRVFTGKYSRPVAATMGVAAGGAGIGLGLGANAALSKYDGHISSHKPATLSQPEPLPLPEPPQ